MLTAAVASTRNTMQRTTTYQGASQLRPATNARTRKANAERLKTTASAPNKLPYCQKVIDSQRKCGSSTRFTRDCQVRSGVTPWIVKTSCGPRLKEASYRYEQNSSATVRSCPAALVLHSLCWADGQLADALGEHRRWSQNGHNKSAILTS